MFYMHSTLIVSDSCFQSVRYQNKSIKITKPMHRVQRRMISVDNFFRIFEIIIFCFVVAICDLVHAVEAMYSLP